MNETEKSIHNFSKTQQEQNLFIKMKESNRLLINFKAIYIFYLFQIWERQMKNFEECKLNCALWWKIRRGKTYEKKKFAQLMHFRELKNWTKRKLEMIFVDGEEKI